MKTWRIALAVAAFFVPTGAYLLGAHSPEWLARIAGAAFLGLIGLCFSVAVLGMTERR